MPFKSRDGSPFFVAPHPVLVVGKVRHVSEAIAVVVGETMSQATDAAVSNCQPHLSASGIPSAPRAEVAGDTSKVSKLASRQARVCALCD